MRRVTVTAEIPDSPPREVFDAVIQFDRYPALAPHVASTEVLRTVPDAVGESNWELHFRSGLLRWTEEETFDPDNTSFTFEQSDGDFDTFTGTWTMTPATGPGAGTVLVFDAEFDFGIASLESILDPIAARVIKETVAWAVSGLFPGSLLDVETDALTAPAAV